MYANTDEMKADLIRRLDGLAEQLGSKAEALELVASHGDLSAGVVRAFWSGYRPNPNGSTLDSLLAQIEAAETAQQRAA